MPDLTPPVRVAVIGAGYFGRFHYDAWSRMPEVELVGLCVRNPEAAREIAERYGEPGAPLPIFTDPAEMMRMARPVLVDITAPPAAHLGLIHSLAPFAPDVICQKPFCDGTPGAREAIALAEAHGFRVAVHENIRFQPWYREAKRLIAAGTLGDLYEITFRLRPGDGQGPRAYLDRQPYFQKMPRFLIHETAVHWIDTFRYLMGEPTGVFARLVRLNPAIAGEDAGLIVFDFAGGARGVFDANRLSDHLAQDRRRTMASGSASSARTKRRSTASNGATTCSAATAFMRATAIYFKHGWRATCPNSPPPVISATRSSRTRFMKVRRPGAT
jgi:predicted dehydrogenase